MKNLKHTLYHACIQYLDHRYAFLTSALQDIQQAANEETKSTAGDKYETARAMAHLEIDKYRMQLTEVNRMRQELMGISTETDHTQVKPGSLVFTSRGNFYIAIHAGQVEVNAVTFFTVSIISPIAQKLTGLKHQDTFTLNGKEFKILKIQ